MTSDTTTVDCPKCGFAQEERLDCRKCGIVFSKYYALYPSGPQGEDETGENAAAEDQKRTIAEATNSAELAQLHQSLRELQRRFNEIEFERAERVRLSGEIQTRDQKTDDLLQQISDRTAALQQRLDEKSDLPERDELARLREDIRSEISALRGEIHATNLDPIEDRIRELESRNDHVQTASVPSKDPELLRRVDELGDRLQQLEASDTTPQPDGEGNGNLLDSVKIIQEIEALRSSLQNVTVRYSEIGELKKNHLIVQNSLESTQRDLVELTNRPSGDDSRRTEELEAEVVALRAEVRQAVARLETPESGPIGQIQKELEGLKSASKVANQHGAEIANLRRDNTAIVSALESLQQSVSSNTNNRSDGSHVDLRAELDQIRSEVRGTLNQVETIETKLEELSNHRSDEDPPELEADVQAIRKNLEQIRQFMGSVSEKV